MSAAAKRQMGVGSLFRQTGKGKSKNYMMSFHLRGRRKFESTGTPDKTEARKVLNARLAAIASGELTDLDTVGRRKALTVAQALTAVHNDLALNQRTCADGWKRTIERILLPAFGADRRFDSITGDQIKAFAMDRINAGAARATVNIDLAIMRRAFNLAIEAKRIARMPKIKCTDPKNARKGFFERTELDQVLPHLPEYWRGVAVFGYYTGWRTASEIASLEWRNVDLINGIVVLDDSKNGDGRSFPYRLVPEVAAAIAAADKQRRALAAAGVIVRYVFHDAGAPLVTPAYGSKRTGDLTKAAYAAWHAACAAAGVASRIPHDFRRTAGRNLIRAGVPIKVAMMITGHKTLSMFMRYGIINESDMTDGIAVYAAHSVAQAQAAAQAAAAPIASPAVA